MQELYQDEEATSQSFAGNRPIGVPFPYDIRARLRLYVFVAPRCLNLRLSSVSVTVAKDSGTDADHLRNAAH
jgi:hypothetical protein